MYGVASMAVSSKRNPLGNRARPWLALPGGGAAAPPQAAGLGTNETMRGKVKEMGDKILLSKWHAGFR